MRDFQSSGRSTVHAQNGMVATSHPLASQAALDVLRSGGNASDSAIAAAAVLAVVEPQMTGIGGDCFAMIAPKGSADVIAYNGSGRAPKAATAERLKADGLSEIAVDSIHSVTLPGAVEAWRRLHADHGTMDFARLMQPAIDYARHGYPIHARVHSDWLAAKDHLAKREHSSAVFLPKGRVPAEGDIHHQERLARTLEVIAAEGAPGFYDGPIADAMLKTLQGMGGLHTAEDFRNVRGEYVTPLTTNYRGFDIHQVPPANQGVTALMMLNILEGFDLAALDPMSAERMHLEVEAGRLAYAMRDAHIADPASMTVTTDSILSKDWAAELRGRIVPDRAMTDIGPLGLRTSDTVYLSIVDRDQTSVSFINSIYDSFGSGIFCPTTGVMFQNRGHSFTLDENHPNCIGPEKRAMHTIMPGMMTKDDKARMSFGVMGGDYQPFGHCRMVSNLVDFGMDLQASIDMPRVFATGAEVEAEHSLSTETIRGLTGRGHAVHMARSALGGAQAITINHERGVLSGGSDPRKDGCALGF